MGNNAGIHAQGFFSKYPYKNFSENGKDIKYKGLTAEAPEHIQDLIVDQVEADCKYVIVYSFKDN